MKPKKTLTRHPTDLQITISPASLPSAQLSATHSISSTSSSSSESDLFQNSLTSPLFSKNNHGTTIPQTNNTTSSLRVDNIKLIPTKPITANSSIQQPDLNHLEWQQENQDDSTDDQTGDLENHLNGSLEEDESDEDASPDERLHWNQTTYHGNRQDEDEDRLGRGDHESDDGEREPLVCHDHNNFRSDGFYSSNNDRIHSSRRPSKARQRRKVYGGGRVDWGGELEIWEVGLGVASNMYVLKLNLPFVPFSFFGFIFFPIMSNF